MSNHLLFLGQSQRKSDFYNMYVRIGLAAIILVVAISLTGMNHGVALAAGTTYYVNNTVACSESGPGSSAQPFCTIGKGAQMAVAGDTVKVVGGTYAETVYPHSGTAVSPITFQGSPGVTVTGQPGTPTTAYSAFALSGNSYVVIDGFNITQTSSKGIYVDSSNHITISNNHVSYAGASSQFHPYEQGIYLKNTTDSTVTGNITDHNTCIGIRLLNNSDYNVVSNNISFSNFSVVETDAAGIELTGASHNTVINNITYSNEDSGINVYVTSPTAPALPVASSYNLIIGNLSYENGDHGIDTNNSPYNTVVGNTAQGNGTVGINFEGEATTGSHHAVIANNISVGNGFTPPTGSFGGNLRVDSASVTGTVTDYNLYNRESATVQIIWNNVNYTSLAAFRVAEPTQDLHSREGNPLFLSPVASVLRVTGVPYVGTGTVGDYHLNSGSPAIDSANSDAPNQPSTDIEKNVRADDPATVNTGAGTRTYDDRGAYEFQPTGYTSTSTTVNCGAGNAATTYASNISCVATVVRAASGNTPSGTVNWNTSGSGVFTTTPCTLSGNGGTATCSVTYRPSSVGTGSHLIQASYVGDLNFLPSSGSQSVTVNTKPLVPGITASSKTYDGTTAATILTRTLTGIVGPDVVALTGGTATFDTKQIGTGKTVSGSAFTLTGANASNYQLSPATATTTANITARDLTVSAAGVNKVYDGTATVAVNLSTNAAAGDTVTAAYTSASFADKNVGSGKAVSVSGISIGGADAGNYHLLNTTASTTANITPLAITVTADARTKFIGTVDPALTYSVLPALVSGDSFTGALTRASGEALGSYSIQQGTLSAGSNYTITFVGANLTIAPLTSSNVDIYMGDKFQKNYVIPPSASVRESYSINNGPVKVVSTNDVPIMAAERVIYKVNNVNTSFSEMMALPNSQLGKIYWLPWYNNVDLDTQLRIGNVSSNTATVHVWIGGVEMKDSPFTLIKGQSLRVSFTGINSGPVKIESNENIVAAERVIYKVNDVNTSFSEMMALPNSQLGKIYWLPWYNNVDLDTQLRIGNVSNNTATVHVWIGGVEMKDSPFTLIKGQSLRVSFTGINSGPVKIESNENIVAAERVIFKVKGVQTSFTEMMALPNSQLNITYWLPWYNNVDLDTQLRIGNVSATPAHVHVYIGGQEMAGSPFTLAKGESTRQSFRGINNGSVKIVSDVPIVAAERVIYTVNNIQTSFSEMMGLPNSLLTTTYWLPWYNNLDLDTQLRFGVP